MHELSFAKPVLVLESATSAGSVALLQDGAVDLVRHVAMGVGREDHLFPAMQALLAERGLVPADVGAVVCGHGPGSFTSLRIAAALAKGLAHGVGAPLYAVPSLALAAASLPDEAPPGRYLVHADALRGDRYVLPVQWTVQRTVEPAGELARLPLATLTASSEASGRVGVGAPADGCVSDWSVTPDAGRLRQVTGTWRLAPVDLADWEPDYGRLAEAQVKWEATHGGPLPAALQRPHVA